MPTYDLDILVNGFPGKTATHGGLGWSSVCLLRDGAHTVLIDTGPPAYLGPLHAELDRLGLAPADVTHILATHLHWDHIGNFTMFPNATVVVGRRELAWASAQPPGTPLVADLHVQRLVALPDRTLPVDAGEETLPGISVLDAPGHTPGHLAYRVATTDGDVLFAGDAVKNRYELATGNVDSSLDMAASRRSVERLRSIMVEEAITMVPGHDVPLAVRSGQVQALAPQTAQFSVFLDTTAGEAPRVIT
jgi:glyoxylase-like metal-dependent hydrolase (beta-lactamase superfamily II)